MTAISTRSFKVELQLAPDGAGFRAARRVIINTAVLTSAKLCSGDVLALSKADNTSGAQKIFAVGVAWPSQEISQDSILISSSLALTAGVVAGDSVQVFPLNSGKRPPGAPSLRQAQEARTVRVREITDPGALRKASATPNFAETEKGKRRDWLPLLVREALAHLKYITATQTLDVVFEGIARRFKVVSVSTSLDASQDSPGSLVDGIEKLNLGDSERLWTVGWDSLISVVEGKDENEGSASNQGLSSSVVTKNAGADAYASVGGLDKQIAQVRDLIEIPLTRPELFRHFGLRPPRGILLHGPPGTGKTHLARAIAASTQSSVLIINGPELSSAYHGETESRLREVFAEARARAPCIVVLDEVDALCPRREDGPGGEVEKRVVAQLLTIMDGVEDEGADGGQDRVVVVATTNRPNAIDPALRRPGRFDREIEIGIPDVEARASILSVLLGKTPHSLTQDEIRSVAARAHGYVGADLSAVVREAGTTAIKRWLALNSTVLPDVRPSTDDLDFNPKLTIHDVLASLTSVRPSALRSVFLDTVPVRYSEIGGQAETIQKLREMVEWPLLHPEAFERLGVRSPKGVLLFGPPGCSKTLLVRACATESGVNFVAVKGPELLNKYVGESERAVREIFRKARAASPSIVFFDEIDALASSRSDSEAGLSHEGVLTSLLNEMDGVQELLGVTVVAATNRPESIDPALMRPGRLDRILYVGPPDQAGREEILRIRLKKMSVQAGLDVTHIASLAEGCSGAELTALCQEAALLTMKNDINAPYVPHEAFVVAARAMKKQITPEVVSRYESWAGKQKG